MHKNPRDLFIADRENIFTKYTSIFAKERNYSKRSTKHLEFTIISTSIIPFRNFPLTVTSTIDRKISNYQHQTGATPSFTLGLCT